MSIGERIPLTMAGHDAEKGTIDLIYAAVGRTTMLMDQLEEGRLPRWMSWDLSASLRIWKVLSALL